MSVGIVEHSIFQYVLQYGFAILQYIAICFLPYCCTPTFQANSLVNWAGFSCGIENMCPGLRAWHHLASQNVLYAYRHQDMRSHGLMKRLAGPISMSEIKIQ